MFGVETRFVSILNTKFKSCTIRFSIHLRLSI